MPTDPDDAAPGRESTGPVRTETDPVEGGHERIGTSADTGDLFARTEAAEDVQVAEDADAAEATEPSPPGGGTAGVPGNDGSTSDGPSGAGPTAGAGTLSVRNAATAPAAPAKRAKPSSRSRRSSRRQRELWAAWAVVGVAAIAGAFVEVSPSGTGWADRLLAAGFVALLAAAGSSAKRWTWFIAAGVGLTLSEGRVALVCGLVAIALALVSTGPIRPIPAVGAAVGGLSGLALLRAADIGFHGSSALLVAAAVAPLLLSGYRYAGRRTRRRTRRILVGSAAVLVVVGAAFALAASRARPAAERGVDLLQEGMDAARDGDDTLATARLAEAADAFAEADRHLGSWYAAPAQVVPVVGHNARAAETMAASAARVSRDGTDAALDADLETLTVQGGHLDLDRVQALGTPLGDVADVLSTAAADLDDVDAIDGPWLVSPVADQLDRVRSEVAAARPDVDLAADATEVIPSMFGADGESRWLVAFVTPVEARGRTGFVGNFAELTAVDGVVDMTRFGRASELESGGTPGDQRTLSGPEDYLERYERFAPASTWRNVTMSPDFPSVGQVMAELYPQSSGQPVDGVIAVDPVGLAALMRFTGPIEVPGVAEPLTADTAADFLLRDQYLIFGDKADRIDTLETLARATFDGLTTGSLPGPGTVADTLGPAVSAGHIHAYGVDAAHQALFEDIGLDGALPEVTGDSLAVVANNAVGNKIDLFLDRDITYEARWNPTTGALSATATVTLTNNAPSEGLPRYVIGSPLPKDVRPAPGTNRTYLSIYSPWTLDGAMLDGGPVTLQRQTERGRYAYSLYLDIPPEGGRRTIVLELSGNVDAGGAYTLDVATQPLVEPDQLALTVDVAGDREIVGDEPLSVNGRTVSATEALTQEATRYRIEVDP